MFWKKELKVIDKDRNELFSITVSFIPRIGECILNKEPLGVSNYYQVINVIHQDNKPPIIVVEKI